MQFHSHREADFVSLFVKSEAAIRGYLATALPLPSDREDVFQEICLVLWSKFSTYDPSRPFTPWALGIATLKLKETWRKQRCGGTPVTPEMLDSLAGKFSHLATPAQVSAQERALRKCLEELPPSSQSIIKQRYFESQAVHAMANQLGINEMALYQTLSRLRRKLAACIHRKLGITSPVTNAM